MVKLPLILLQKSRFDELEKAERELRRIQGITMIVEAAQFKDGVKHRQILYRNSLENIPDQLTYMGSQQLYGRFMRLLGMDAEPVMYGDADYGIDILFMEAST